MYAKHLLHLNEKHVSTNKNDLNENLAQTALIAGVLWNFIMIYTQVLITFFTCYEMGGK